MTEPRVVEGGAGLTTAVLDRAAVDDVLQP